MHYCKPYVRGHPFIGAGLNLFADHYFGDLTKIEFSDEKIFEKSVAVYKIPYFLIHLLIFVCEIVCDIAVLQSWKNTRFTDLSPQMRTQNAAHISRVKTLQIANGVPLCRKSIVEAETCE